MLNFPQFFASFQAHWLAHMRQTQVSYESSVPITYDKDNDVINRQPLKVDC